MRQRQRQAEPQGIGHQQSRRHRQASGAGGNSDVGGEQGGFGQVHRIPENKVGFSPGSNLEGTEGGFESGKNLRGGPARQGQLPPGLAEMFPLSRGLA